MRRSVKTLLNGFGAIIVLPAVGCYRLAAVLVGQNAAFSGWSQFLSLLPGLTGEYLRRAFYRWTLSECELGSVVGFGTVLTHPAVTLGANVYLGPYGCLGDVAFEDNVLIGAHVSITNGSRQHGIERLDVPVREQPGEWPRVTIGCDSWVGDRAVVMANIGKHCVVGAGSVVTRPVPDYAIVAGVPARIIGWRGGMNDRRANRSERGTEGSVSPAAAIAESA